LQGLSNYQKWIIDYFKPYLYGQCIEYGAGTGTYSALLQPYAERLILVEPSPNLAAELRSRFEGEKEISVIEDSLETHVSDREDSSTDTIVLINVLEHIKDDKNILDEFYRVLKPGGNLLLFVPALNFLFSNMDRVLKHYRRYNLKDLGSIVEDSGFTIIDARYFDFLGIFPWWLIFTLGGKEEFNSKLSVLYDRLGVPASRFIEGLARPLFGKNIILVARHDQ